MEKTSVMVSQEQILKEKQEKYLKKYEQEIELRQFMRQKMYKLLPLTTKVIK
jgi:hypothetical protein